MTGWHGYLKQALFEDVLATIWFQILKHDNNLKVLIWKVVNLHNVNIVAYEK